MVSVEIDFDLFKALTIRRSSENETISDVIRKALASSASSPQAKGETAQRLAAIYDGEAFPEGTLFRTTYKGRLYSAEIKGGRWQGQDGAIRRSPSDAARAITGNNVNGWRFWKAKRPGDSSYRLMDQLRGR